MSSEVDVINVGLLKLGAKTCTARSDEGTGPEFMNARYDEIRDAELRRNRWRFSLKRASLSALVTVPVGTIYTLEYQLPPDCLQLVQVGEFYSLPLTDYRTSDESPYSLEGRKILTNLPAPLIIRYVQRVTDATQFDSCFVESLGARLAYEGALKITGSQPIKDGAWGDYKTSLDEAIIANAIETPPQAIADDSWVLARLS